MSWTGEGATLMRWPVRTSCEARLGQGLLMAMLLLCEPGAVAGDGKGLDGLREACKGLDALAVEWTEIVRRGSSDELLSVGTHDFATHNGRIRHVSWVCAGESASKFEGLAKPESDEAWKQLASAVRLGPVRVDEWDGVRHTMCTPNSDETYTATVLASPRYSELFVRPLEWILYYGESRIDSLGELWDGRTETGQSGQLRGAFCAPSVCFYFAFDDAGDRPVWTALWRDGWAGTRVRLRGIHAIEELEGQPEFLGGAKVLAWQPTGVGRSFVPALVRHFRPHVKQVSVTRVGALRLLSGPLAMSQIPVQIDGRRVVFSDEVTNEAFVREADGSRRVLREGSSLGSQGTVLPDPPQPRRPADHPPAGGPGGEHRQLDVLLVLLGCAAGAVGVFLFRRSRARAR